MKEGHLERFEETPGPQYPGGVEASQRLQGKLSYYRREELLALLQGFEILCEQKLIPGDGGFEFWVRK